MTFHSHNITADFLALGGSDLLRFARVVLGGNRGLALDETQEQACTRDDGDLQWPLALARNDWPAGCVRFACADFDALSIPTTDTLLDYIALMRSCAREFLAFTGLRENAQSPWPQPRNLFGLFANLGLHDASLVQSSEGVMALLVRLDPEAILPVLAHAPSPRHLPAGVHIDGYFDGQLRGWLDVTPTGAPDSGEYSLRHAARVLARFRATNRRLDVLRAGHYGGLGFEISLPPPLPPLAELDVVDSDGRHLSRLDIPNYDPRGGWIDWNGQQLSWWLDAQACSGPAVELLIDGVVFRRFAIDRTSAGHRSYRCGFPFAPIDRSEIEFSLREEAADPSPIGKPWKVSYGVRAPESRDPARLLPTSQSSVPSTPIVPPHARLLGLSSVAIVVPIYNSADALQRCITSILRWTRGPASLILINDGSTDPAIARLLDNIAATPRVLIHHSDRNRGYTHSVNLGIAYADRADVILLNSDTQVGPGWLEALRHAAYADETVGTVTAVSNNAGAFSVPDYENECPVPDRWELPMAQRALLQQVGAVRPEMPTGNGFCMFIKRQLLDRIGAMDEEAFPSGYGEENDFCMRAVRVGLRNIIAGRVLVGHLRSASFGHERRVELGQRGMEVLRERYPEYERAVQIGLHSYARNVLDYRVRRTYAGKDPRHALHPPRARVLFVVSAEGSNAAQAVDLLTPVLHEHYDCFVLRWDSQHLGLYRQTDSGRELIQAQLVERCDLFASSTWTEYEACLRDWLAIHAIELVHVFHLAWHSPHLPEIANALGIPVVYTFTDFHTVCPSAQLLDERQQFCSGRCTPGAGPCTADFALGMDYPALKHGFVRRWKKMQRRWLAAVSAFTVGSAIAREVLMANHPWLADRDLQLIELTPDTAASAAWRHARLYRECWKRLASFTEDTPEPKLIVVGDDVETNVPGLAPILAYAAAAGLIHVWRADANLLERGPDATLLFAGSAEALPAGKVLLIDSDGDRLRERLDANPASGGIFIAAKNQARTIGRALLCDPAQLPRFNAHALCEFIIEQVPPGAQHETHFAVPSLVSEHESGNQPLQ